MLTLRCKKCKSFHFSWFEELCNKCKEEERIEYLNKYVKAKDKVLVVPQKEEQQYNFNPKRMNEKKKETRNRSKVHSVRNDYNVDNYSLLHNMNTMNAIAEDNIDSMHSQSSHSTSYSCDNDSSYSHSSYDNSSCSSSSYDSGSSYDSSSSYF